VHRFPSMAEKIHYRLEPPRSTAAVASPVQASLWSPRCPLGDKRQRLEPVSECGRAFTLVEILVVLAIMGILAVLLLPAVSSFDTQAKQARCVSNLRRIAAAFHTYAADNGGRFPYAFGDPAPDPSASGGWNNTWASRVAPYLDAKGNSARESAADILSCPSRTEAVSANVATYGINSYMRVGFGGWVIEPNDPKWNYLVARVPDPSRIILVGDMQAANDETLPTADKQSYMGSQGRGPGFRHGAKNATNVDQHTLANMAFCDGHVESLDASKLLLYPPDLASEPIGRRSRWKWW